MIKTFLHKGLRDFFEKGSKAGILPQGSPANYGNSTMQPAPTT
ncbi:hypothetical protein [Verminephrobacter aporrectodeae]